MCSYVSQMKGAVVLTTVEDLPEMFTFQPYVAVAELLQPMPNIATGHNLQRNHVLIDIESICQLRTVDSSKEWRRCWSRILFHGLRIWRSACESYTGNDMSRTSHFLHYKRCGQIFFRLKDNPPG